MGGDDGDPRALHRHDHRLLPPLHPAGRLVAVDPLSRREREEEREREPDRKGTVNRGSAAYKLPNLTMAMA
jgi:hypothetical protein